MGAHQLHVSNSKIFKKAAVLAGPPYYCAIDNFFTATTTCMQGTGNINVKQLVQWANNAAALGYIDDTENLLDSRVFVLSGSLDTVIVPKVATEVSEFYSEVGLDDSLMETVYNIPSEHGWISDSVGGPCDEQNPPDYFQNCGYDLSLEVASWLYADVNQTKIENFRKIGKKFDSKKSTGELVKFSQDNYCSGNTCSRISMDSTGFVYIPDICENGGCKLAVVLHGCLQGYEFIGTDFIEKTGWNEIADDHGFVVLFPQAVSSNFNPSNLGGCWDWWGYNTNLYATKNGKQVKAIMGMVADLMGR